MRHYSGFSNMADVIAHIKKGEPLYYQAPLSPRPAFISGIARPFGKERVYIRANEIDRECDPFTADSKHLDRFLRLA